MHASDQDTFPGFRRSDGSVGVRNHLLVLSTVALTNRLAELVSRAAPGCLLIAPDFMRGLRGHDQLIQDRVLDGLVSHPNVGAVLVLAHDAATGNALRERYRNAGRPFDLLVFMDAHGMADAVEKGRAALVRLAKAIEGAPRTPAPLSSLVVALECGGSDASSALCANPVIGRFVDRHLAGGGTAIVSETAEFIGAEPIIRSRSATRFVTEQILERISRTEKMMQEDGEDYRGINPTPENIAAGLTTLIEKSMGAIAKTGHALFNGCLNFAEPPQGKGLHFMDTPFFSPVSMTGMACAGAHLVLFGMGVFNPSGNPLAPTIKVCGNPETVRRWADSLDLDASGILTADKTLDEMADRLRDVVVQVAGGSQSRAEDWREGQIIAPRSLPAL
ncbi:MAG: UxaA family hydrolase [Betaproteobacteria bacterium]|nr:UxaA family hydrolase [Betaproteobacteria bacterium]